MDPMMRMMIDTEHRAGRMLDATMNVVWGRMILNPVAWLFGFANVLAYQYGPWWAYPVVMWVTTVVGAFAGGIEWSNVARRRAQRMRR